MHILRIFELHLEAPPLDSLPSDHTAYASSIYQGTEALMAPMLASLESACFSPIYTSIRLFFRLDRLSPAKDSKYVSASRQAVLGFV